MVCAKTTVLHESGLHMRPAQEFVSAVANYPCKVTIKVGR
ncbi:MAG: HPr family phosphocarrier protein [Oscillospiraceae bacterium]